MHELAIMQSVVNVCEREAKSRGFRRVESITLSVGAVSGIVPECLYDFFPTAAKGSVAEGAFRRDKRYGVPALRRLGLQAQAGTGILY